MPFDLVIDEHTADGQEARVSKTSVAGSWGAVAGSLRFFADRFGVARGRRSRDHAVLRSGPQHAVARPAAGRPRRAAQAAGARGRAAALLLRVRSGYRGRAVARDRSPSRSALSARDVLADALLAGETVHPDQGRLKRAVAHARRAVAAFGRVARRSPRPRRCAAPCALQLDRVQSWDDFFSTRLALDPAALVDEATRAPLDALPAMVRVRGDAVPLDYEVEDGAGGSSGPAQGRAGQAAPDG